MKATARTIGLLVLLVLPWGASGCPSVTAAAEPPGEELAPPPSPEEAPPPDPDGTAPAASPPDATSTLATEEDGGENDPCRVASGADWLDRVRRGVFRGVCGTARWFDGFFGDRRFDEEAQRTHGRAQVRLIWDEFDGFDPQGRLRVRVDLPNLDDRVNAFVGRDDESFISDRTQGEQLLPDFFQDAGDQEWLLGLGYSPVGNAQRRLDFDGGVKVNFPLQPFVRARYRQYWLVGEDNLLRFRETLFWRNQQGLGATTGVDVERALGERRMVRWENRGTVDQEAEGLEWATGVTFYQGLTPRQALAFYVGAEGETDAAVALREYGTRVTYRRQLPRDWLFGEIIGGVTWPRDQPGAEREAAWHLGFGIEIHFAGRELGAGSGRPRLDDRDE